MRSDPRISVVGASGAVGIEFLKLFEQRGTPMSALRLFASRRSAGRTLACCGQELVIEEASADAFAETDFVFFSAGASTSRALAPVAAEAGAVVIDNSSAFRMAADIPLVVPEVNPGDLPDGPGIIANPNCSTIIMLVALEPIRRAFGIERIVVSTYQAASGAGAAAMHELEQQTRDLLAGKPIVREVFPEQCAFNVFSHNSNVDMTTGRNVEEQKMIDETRKIWKDPSVRVSATCMRVPVMRAHGEAINVTLSTPATEAEIRGVLNDAAGVQVIDDREANLFPTPIKASGIDDVLVGRIRPDTSQDIHVSGAQQRYMGFDLFACADQIRKGAALNALQIAEVLWKRQLA